MTIWPGDLVKRHFTWNSYKTDDELSAQALDEALHRHVFDAWFPRCVDSVNGGFLCDFDRPWRPDGRQARMLEFQARQTRVAALALQRGMAPEVWEPICRHGFAYLRDVMWDSEYGGWYAICDASGKPLDRGDKHAHGTAYAIMACLEVAKVLDLPEAHRLASEAFAWLDAHAWDRDFGGYWGWLRRDGMLYVMQPDKAPAKQDHIAVPLGAKDVNVAGDMIESLTELCRDENERVARDRLGRLVEWLDQAVKQNGRLPVYFTRALATLNDVEHSGYEFQASYRLPEARARLGAPLIFGPVERTLRAHALAHLGSTGAPSGFNRAEEWWIAFEWLRSSLFAYSLDGDAESQFLQDAEVAWRRIQRVHLDPEYGGVYTVPQRGKAPSIKGDCWKDASHEALALSRSAGYLRAA